MFVICFARCFGSCSNLRLEQRSQLNKIPKGGQLVCFGNSEYYYYSSSSCCCCCYHYYHYYYYYYDDYDDDDDYYY